MEMESDLLGYSNILQVIGGLSILLLLAGLSLLEAGVSRKKNVNSALTRNLACLPLSITAFWATGYAFAFGGGSSMIGYSKYFALYGTNNSLSHFFVHSLVASLPSSIIGGAMAERSHITGHLVMSVLLSGLVYPVAAHWIWDNEGWLRVRNCVDVGGILPLHVFSGSVALVGCLIVGRRQEKFGQQYRKRIQGHSTPLGYTGGALIIVGLLGKSVGLTADMPSIQVGQVVTNCLLSCVGAGTISVFLCKLSCSSESSYEFTDMTRNNVMKFGNRKWSLYGCLNGCLAGLVGVQGGVGLYTPWAAWVVGLVAGVLYFIIFHLLVFCRIDDPTQAIAIHLAPGVWGMVAAALLGNLDFVGEVVDRVTVLSWGLAGVAGVFAWSSLCAVVIMLILLFIRKLRVDVSVETLGLDAFKTEEQAYADCLCDGGGQFSSSTGRSTKPTYVRPLGVVPASSRGRQPSVVELLVEASKVKSDKTDIGKRRVTPTILIEDLETNLKNLRTPSTSPNPQPPPYCPSISVSSEVDVFHSSTEPSTEQRQANTTAHMDIDRLRVTLKQQKKRLKATTSLMRNPSPTLMNREFELDSSANSSITASLNGTQAGNSNKQNPLANKVEEKGSEPAELSDYAGDLYTTAEDENVSGLDAESGFGGSQSIIGSAVIHQDLMVQLQKTLKPRVTDVNEEVTKKDGIQKINNGPGMETTNGIGSSRSINSSAVTHQNRSGLDTERGVGATRTPRTIVYNSAVTHQAVMGQLLKTLKPRVTDVHEEVPKKDNIQTINKGSGVDAEGGGRRSTIPGVPVTHQALMSQLQKSLTEKPGATKVNEEVAEEDDVQNINDSSLLI